MAALRRPLLEPPMTLPRLLSTVSAAVLLGALPLAAAAQAAVPAPAPAPAPKFETRTTSLPAKGLFSGNDLSAAARQRLTDLIVEAIGLQIEVALVVPTGPWQLDGSGPDERHLTPARLEAVKRFLQQRGVDPKQIYVESRIDEKIAEPRLDIQVGGREARD